ncbi:MAG: DUF1266 domain-containing protein [Deltaproteobacteria bacterium]|nr:DUF1266 domain-containing protein [Deltaproteobacteria bacterium]MBK8715196.1 DUF1266 domain-containing protein [Deltaproteobacteria bacterium]MBP7285098.1 DUF1266 domain-containing protein [Nannocystaceae bacterium]
MGWLSRLFSGEDAETREARRRMAVDMQDPRKTFVWGVVSISYELDPAYLPAHANTAIREWYGVRSADDILRWTAADFTANAHPGYNQYRLCFLARAGYGAGVLDEATSWSLAIPHAAVLQQHYPDWLAYGHGYLEGHLSYRAGEGDDAAKLAEIRKRTEERIALRQRTVWCAIPWHTPMS